MPLWHHLKKSRIKTNVILQASKGQLCCVLSDTKMILKALQLDSGYYLMGDVYGDVC